MKVHWNKLVVRVAIWVVGEILLGLIGLDTLADYSEFFSEHQENVPIVSTFEQHILA